ncbi:PREDICTED: aluminum-activated malate transporter 8-like [Populus euphratica]|uniref:Aluminum-activated malate transporter 8-like n=1 Tax=Populus euphratica TaxID=75702 RepID=A0AAJ6V793_POPEU|nr:PREDICTED: aluminum-activated malate transporter 8-like [Populus euphratica]
MEIDQPTIQQKAGHFTRAWSWFKALPGEAKAKAIELAKGTKKLGEDDPRRVIHSLKVGLALTFVSSFYYSRPLYDGFGVSGMWAVLTVAVIFEFTVGGTLSKGLFRGLATLLACALGFGASNLASLFGRKGQPFVLRILVFVLAAASTFTRFFPRIKARYDYGFVIFILAFSLVSVSGYRVEKLLVLTHQRLSTVLIGGATCILLSFIFPVWAGEDLHKLVASNVEKLAKYLEGFEGEFFQPLEDGRNVKVSNSDKSFLQGYKKVLNSKSTEESVANLARWEPGHGRFGFRHPWKQYLKIGALSRQCAYQIEALDAYINSHNQAPLNFRCKIQGPCTRMFIECSMALESLASAIKTMTLPSSANVHVENSKTAIKDLKIAIKTVSLDQDQDLLAIVPAATVASIIIEIVKCVENLSESVHELSNLAHFKSVESTVSLEKPQFLHRGSIKPVLEGDADRVIIAIDGKSADSPESENTQGPMPGQRLEV